MNREIDDKFKSLESKLLDEREGILPRIERQTCKTNGRVTRLEIAAIVMITAIGVLTINNQNAGALVGLFTHLLGF